MLASENQTEKASSMKRNASDDVVEGERTAGLSPHKRQATASAKVKSVRLELGKEVGLPQGASFHPDHNYPDGSIIIHMQNRLFRLYRDSLARKSSYFRDRFNQELQPISRNDILLGLCPIMQVPEGNARHFAVLLDALEDFSVLLETRFSIVASILVSSSELRFPTMQNWAIASLEKLWPDDYRTVLPKHIPDAVETVALARTYSIPKVRKRAMYEIARSDDFATLLYMKDENSLISDDTDKALLSAEEVRQLIASRERMSIFWVDSLRWYPPSKNEHYCFQDKPRAWKDIHRTTLTLNCLFDPIIGLALVGNTAPWSTPCELKAGCFVNSAGEKIKEGGSVLAVFEPRSRSIDWGKCGICRNCANSLRSVFEDKQKRLWEKLAEWFGLPAAPEEPTCRDTITGPGTD